VNIQKIIKYWKKSAEKDFETAKTLFKLKHYPYCLFFSHLALEKLLKGLVVRKTKKHAPYTHDLVYLAELANTEKYFKIFNGFYSWLKKFYQKK
jgi:HEPN domain-containing protein